MAQTQRAYRARKKQEANVPAAKQNTLASKHPALTEALAIE